MNSVQHEGVLLLAANSIVYNREVFQWNRRREYHDFIKTLTLGLWKTVNGLKTSLSREKMNGWTSCFIL